MSILDKAKALGLKPPLQKVGSKAEVIAKIKALGKGEK